MADAVRSWSTDSILKKHLPHRGSVDEDDQNWDDKKDWISNIPAKKWPEDPAEWLSNARHEFGEYGGVKMSIEASVQAAVMEPDTLRTMFAGEMGRRHFKPTVLNLGRQMAALEGTEAAYCTASGMSAISASGSHIVTSRCLYGGIHPLLSRLLSRSAGIKTSFVDFNDLEAVQAAVMEGGTRLKKWLMLVVDNTFTPMVVSPARLGADVVVHSVSKFISGGADIIIAEEEEEPEEEEEESTQLYVIEIFMSPMTSSSSYPTMKIEGQVMGKTVVTMIDSGATHNFIDRNLVQELGVRVDEREGLGARLATGQRAQCLGFCMGLTLSVQGTDITQNFVVVDLKCADLILGMQWLGTLGETKVNWKTLRFEYKQGKRRVVLRGKSNLVTSRPSSSTVMS